jgi:AraC-like DNA-binding protein
MHDDFTVPVEYARPIADHLRSIGVGPDGWPKDGGVSDACFAEPGGLLSYGEFRQLVLAAIAAAKEPALGLFVGARLVASTHGMVGTAAVSAGTVRQALDVVEQFSRLRSSLITISRDITALEVRLVFSEVLPLGDIQRPVFEAVVLSIKNILDDITMGAAEVREVAFPFAKPEYAVVARDLFGCPVRYGQDWAGFSAPTEVLDLPVRRADPTAFEEAARICQRELDRISAEESTGARVRRLLLADQNGFPSLAVTARLLHMSPRTLHRRLVDEGTSYRELLESVRHTLAIQHVRSGRFSMEEIAYRLGYSDLANFRRAFKRWESVPPSAFRAQQRTR